MFKDIVNIKQLIYYWRCSFSSLELHARYGWQATPQTHITVSSQYVILYTFQV